MITFPPIEAEQIKTICLITSITGVVILIIFHIVKIILIAKGKIK